MSENEDIYRKSGQRILVMRNIRGYTREYLAERANISPKFLYEIENGKKGFSAYVLYNICRALKVKSDYILAGTEEGFNDKITAALELFEAEEHEHIAEILKHIYEMKF